MTIWIDLDNTPHVPLFGPIIRELRSRGYDVLVTARDCFQVCDLARLLQIDFQCVGRHFGKNKLLKVVGLGSRALQLLPIIARQRPTLAISHGSRAQLLVASTLRIPSMLLMDYEFVRGLRGFKPDWLMVPELIPKSAVHFNADRVLQYPGIKEDVYVPEFKPDPALRAALRLEDAELVVTLRPPATEAHYHVPESDVLFRAVVNFLGEQSHVKTVLLPRNGRQEEEIRREWPALFEKGRMIVPKHTIDGLNLLWHSDLVLSGGGTMNREAAAMRIPVYSVFRGLIGAVDRYLAQTGRLVLLENAQELRSKLRLEARDRSKNLAGGDAVLQSIVTQIVAVADGCLTPLRASA